MSPRRGLVACAVLGLALLLPACGGSDKEGGSQTAPAETAAGTPLQAPDFSGAAAEELVKQQVAFGPRVPDTPAHEKQLQWMTSYLRQRADTVEVHTFDVAVTDTTLDLGGVKYHRSARTLHLANVFARFNPAAHDRVLLLAHWDTRPTADYESDSARIYTPIPGANDGGSGVAVLMELADVLKRHSPPIGVDLLFVDGEDYTGDMYLGAIHFAANLPPGYQPLYGVLVDMVGDEHPLYPIEPSSQQYAPEVVERVWRTAEQLGFGQYFVRTEGPGIEDDHIPMNKAGIHTIDIIDFDYGPGNAYWHTLQDTVEHTSPTGLEAVGKTLGALIYAGG